MAPLLFFLGNLESRAWPILTLTIFGLGRGLYDGNTMPVLAEIARPEIRSTGYGIFNLCSRLAGGMATAAASHAKETLGLSAAFQTAALLLLASCALLWTTSRKKRPLLTPIDSSLR